MIPKKLILNNFLSHSKSSINFDNFNVALILGKFNNDTDESNGAGKSSLISSIEWALFDKSRHKKKDKVVKRDAKKCSVVFEFKIDEELYKIVRRRDKIAGESDVAFYQWDGTGWTNIGCDTKTATDAKIEKIINFDHDIFINSVYFKQGDVSLFTDSTAGKRKDIIKSLLKLYIWDEYQKKAKSYAKIYQGKLDAKKALLVDINSIDEEVDSLTIEINDLEKNIAVKNNSLNTVSEKFIASKTKYQSILDFNSKAKLKEAYNLLSKDKSRLNSLTASLKSTDKQVQKYDDTLSKLCKERDSLKSNISKMRLTDPKKAREGIIKGKTKEQVLKQRIDQLQKNTISKNCEECLRPIDNKTAQGIRKHRKDELKRVKADHAGVSKKLKVAEGKLIKLEKDHEYKNNMILQLNKILIKISSVENTYNTLKVKKSDIENSMAQININARQKEINDIKSRYSKSNIDEIYGNLDDLEKRVESFREEIDQLNIRYGSCVSRKEALAEKKKEQEKLQEEVYQLNSQFLLYDKLKNYFGKDGVQSVIIENVVSELESYSNQILSKICNEPTSVSIKMQRQSEKGTWTETFDISINIGGITDDLESLSGGEKFRVSLALRLALSKILSKRMGGVIKFLLLDEVSSSLDNKGLGIFADIIMKLGNDMKVLVISHDDRMKERIPDVIMVSKDALGSVVNV